MAGKEYTADSIAALNYPDGVRKRPDMYIGDRGIDGLHHLAYEIIDNSVDEHLAGFASQIRVSILENSVIEVEDNGRGIPVDMHPTEKIPAIEVVLSKLHAGGKFDRDSYKVSGGLHGVGLSVVNALSNFLEAEVYRNGTVYHIRFEKGVKKTELKKMGKTDKVGTLIRFQPDDTIFQTTKYSENALSSRLREIAFLSPGLTMTLEDRLSVDEENPLGYKVNTFQYNDGIVEFLKNELNEDYDLIFPEPIQIKDEQNGVAIDIAFQYRNSGDEAEIYSYVNNIHTKNHGIHVEGFWLAYEKVMQQFAVRLNLDKKAEKVDKKTLSFGFTCVINTRIPNAEFKGQTKDKLTEPIEVRTQIKDMVEKNLSLFFEKNIELSKKIVEKAILELKALQEAEKAREGVRNNIKGKRGTAAIIAGKLADCSTRKKELRELFIVEGDSAGGSAKQGRDREFQAILPLRGKILNVEKKIEKSALNTILANEEIKTMIAVLGTGYYTNFDIEKLNYHKIVVMTDADVDGAHIKTLLLTFFYRFMRKLIEEGHVYIAQPPLYKISHGKKLEYAYSDAERDKIVKEKFKGNSYDVQRYKGLGEMNPDQLWETTMNPMTRKMTRVTITDFDEAEKMLKVLMGEDNNSGERKKFILSNINFVTNVDDIG